MLAMRHLPDATNGKRTKKKNVEVFYLLEMLGKMLSISCYLFALFLPSTLTV
jgi:hypothetical protein